MSGKHEMYQRGSVELVCRAGSHFYTNVGAALSVSGAEGGTKMRH